jgi:DNA-binding transcriptional regulator/RsmH inhibitor MraZ
MFRAMQNAMGADQERSDLMLENQRNIQQERQLAQHREMQRRQALAQAEANRIHQERMQKLEKWRSQPEASEAKKKEAELESLTALFGEKDALEMWTAKHFTNYYNKKKESGESPLPASVAAAIASRGGQPVPAEQDVDIPIEGLPPQLGLQFKTTPPLPEDMVPVPGHPAYMYRPIAEQEEERSPRSAIEVAWIAGEGDPQKAMDFYLKNRPPDRPTTVPYIIREKQTKKNATDVATRYLGEHETAEGAYEAAIEAGESVQVTDILMASALKEKRLASGKSDDELLKEYLGLGTPVVKPPTSPTRKRYNPQTGKLETVQ